VKISEIGSAELKFHGQKKLNLWTGAVYLKFMPAKSMNVPSDINTNIRAEKMIG
jgi:hypothetical protein